MNAFVADKYNYDKVHHGCHSGHFYLSVQSVIQNSSLRWPSNLQGEECNKPGKMADKQNKPGMMAEHAANQARWQKTRNYGCWDINHWSTYNIHKPMDCMQSTLLGEKFSFSLTPFEFLQILHEKRITISTIECPASTVNVYDSLTQWVIDDILQTQKEFIFPP